MAATMESDASAFELNYEVMAYKWHEFGSAKNHITPREKRIKGTYSKFRSDGLQRLDREQGDGSVHMSCLAKETVPNNTLTGYYLGPINVISDNVGRALSCPPKICMRIRNK